MVILQEEKNRRQSLFTKIIKDEEGRFSSQRTVLFPFFQVEIEGFRYFVPYDDNMNVISMTFQFLNYKMRESPFTSRKKAAYALRLLYCFLSLTNHSLQDLDELAILELRAFLRGINTSPKNSFSYKTLRSNSTVNEYFSVYREFFKFAGINCEAIFRSHNVNSYMFEDASIPPNQIRYDNNLRTSNNSNTIPPFITPDQFRKIYKEMQNAKDLQACIIVKLMYVYGLRLGEVLGLTIEDFQEEKKDGKLIPVLYLRNRMSDEVFQFAKGLPHVIDRRQYSSGDYKSQKQRVVLTYAFYDEVLEFIGRHHNVMSQKYPENYEHGIADIVSSEFIQSANHYVFLNRYGRVLSDQNWNMRLKHYFNKVGIPIDHNSRENNLSHRFRHGFAMFHAYFREHHVDALKLQEMMRHRSITSTMVYYNPTSEYEFEEKTEFQNELYDLIPELKEGLPYDASDNS